LTRALLTTGIFPPDIGGPATYIPNFSSYLKKNGIEVQVITLSSEEKSSKMDYPYSVVRIKRNRKRLKRILITIKKISESLRKADDLFCNGLYYETAIAIRITRFSGNSVVKIVGDPVWEREENRVPRDREKSLFFSVFYKTFGKLERLFLVWSLKQFRNITCPGRELGRTINMWDSSFKPVVIENGVQISDLIIRETKKFDLICVSRLVPWKNVGKVITLAKTLNCSLAVIGDGPIRSELQDLASNNSKIVFLGARDSAFVRRSLIESKVFCQFSDYEGLSFSLLQAMSLGIPCLLSKIPANKAVFESDPSAAIYFADKDVPDIIDQVKSLISSDLERQELGAKCRKIIAKHFNEDIQLQKMRMLLVNHE
jgi:glycosyltransferase involved in cell wall biosynthesis